MQTEALFENIAERIQEEINKAQKLVIIAVAWFTNEHLFNELINKAKDGCSVSLIISDDEINTALDFSLLETEKSKVYRVGNGQTELMHNKFCVIDNNVVINGSYNWSYKAESNFENVVITIGDTTLAQQFITEFYNIRNRYFPQAAKEKEEAVFPLDKVIKRLEILKNYIMLEDTEELEHEAPKLKEYGFNQEIEEIISNLERQEYSSAINRIINFISRNQQLAIWTDPEIAALKLELNNLENQLNAYDNEKIELEKLLSEFQHRHAIELGEIILEILRLRKLKFKEDPSKAKEAEEDEKQYQEQFNTEQSKQIFEITKEEKAELKKKYRKASNFCHPDKVSDELKEAANEIFIDLNEAYKMNDLKKVSSILEELEKGNYFKTKFETISEKESLKAAIAKLQNQIKTLEKEIVFIKESETYQRIINIDSLDDYFRDTKEKLQKELNGLQKELGVKAQESL